MKGKKDISKLVPKKIVDKRGRTTTVYVKPEELAPTNKYKARFQEEFVRKITDARIRNILTNMMPEKFYEEFYDDLARGIIRREKTTPSLFTREGVREHIKRLPNYPEEKRGEQLLYLLKLASRDKYIPKGWDMRTAMEDWLFANNFWGENEKEIDNMIDAVVELRKRDEKLTAIHYGSGPWSPTIFYVNTPEGTYKHSIVASGGDIQMREIEGSTPKEKRVLFYAENNGWAIVKRYREASREEKKPYQLTLPLPGLEKDVEYHLILGRPYYNSPELRAGIREELKHYAKLNKDCKHIVEETY